MAAKRTKPAAAAPREVPQFALGFRRRDEAVLITICRVRAADLDPQVLANMTAAEARLNAASLIEAAELAEAAMQQPSNPTAA